MAGSKQTAQTSEPVTLENPIKRGDQVIDKITLRKPKAGELRGLALIDIANLDVIAMQKLLPRISAPTLTEQDVAELEPGDLLALGGEIAGFFARKMDRYPTG